MKELIPEEKIQNSTLFQNVIKSYTKWFHEIDFNEYFEESWQKLFEYIKESEISWWSLEKVFYEIQKIKKKELTEKLSFEEQQMLGHFLTCFPNYEDISVLNIALNYFQEFTLFEATCFPVEFVNITKLDQIRLGNIWSSYISERTKSIELKRERKVK